MAKQMKNNEKNQTRNQTQNQDDTIRPDMDKSISSDVLGSYTGVPEDPYEKPIQDADDL